MSYIECKSFVTGKENVQYGLIDVELTHNKHNTSISFNNTSDNRYYNTAPDSFGTQTVKEAPGTSTGWGYTGITTKGITGRQTQGYSASGVLNSNYVNVYNGKFPIISKQIINEKNLDEGLNTFDLFETTNNKVILEVTKLKHSAIKKHNDTFINLDGSVVNDPYIIPSIRIVQILKSNNKVISELDMLSLYYGGWTLPIEFTLDTAIFRIKNFNPAYATNSYYSTRNGMWFDKSSGSGNKMYVEGGISDTEGDFVGMEFSILLTEYWRGETTSGTNTLYKNKIVNSDGSEATDANKMNLNTKVHSAWIRNEISVNPDIFINFSVANGYTHHKVDTNDAIYTFAESFSNGNKEYKTISSNGDNENIYINKNMLITPIIAPYVDSNYNPSDGNSNGIYIPLTSTVFEGDPEEPVDPPGPDEPEDVEPADDPGTDYTPSLPGDIEPGEKTWDYLGGDIIGGDPGAYNLFRPSYSNFIFNSYYKDNTEWNQNSAWEFINDCMNASGSEYIRTTYGLVTGKPDLDEIVARVYEIPFEYKELFKDSVGIREASPVYGYVGPLTFEYNIKGEPQGDARYYKEIINRFYPLDLGSTNIHKVFNNYLDYTNTSYKLNLPYGAGVIELDPDVLFNVGVVSASIKLNGYLDFDTGTLIIKVIVNSQLYYETSVNVAVDRVALANKNASVQSFFAKASIAIATAIATKSYKSLLHDLRSNEAEEKYQEHRKQRKEDQSQRDAKIIDRENKIQENYNNTWFDRYYKDYELKEKLIDKQTEFMRAQTEAAKELMKTGFVFKPQGSMMDGIQNGGD